MIIITENNNVTSLISKLNLTLLLNRPENQFDQTLLKQEVHGKTIAITGAGGSIGSQIARLVSELGAECVLLLGHGENSIYLIYHELKALYPTIDYLPIIVDIRDGQRMASILAQYQPDSLYHAAAHKHVPLMELNPQEAFTNNVLGTYRVAQAVHATQTPKMVMVSTDKAVSPTSVMGASKCLAEWVVSSFNQISESAFITVRFGNVLGSRGSMIQVFSQQLAQGGPLTVTDYRMRRYLMTVAEAAQLVVTAGAYRDQGHLFTLDMGEAVLVKDVALSLADLYGYPRDAVEMVEVGVRPGEKLDEDLLAPDERIAKRLQEAICVVERPSHDYQEMVALIENLRQTDAVGIGQEMLDIVNPV